MTPTTLLLCCHKPPAPQSTPTKHSDCGAFFFSLGSKEGQPAPVSVGILYYGREFGVSPGYCGRLTPGANERPMFDNRGISIKWPKWEQCRAPLSEGETTDRRVNLSFETELFRVVLSPLWANSVLNPLPHSKLIHPFFF